MEVNEERESFDSLKKTADGTRTNQIREQVQRVKRCGAGDIAQTKAQTGRHPNWVTNVIRSSCSCVSG
jgi:hypothetical protein